VINTCTKFDVFSFISYKDRITSDTEFTKWGGSGSCASVNVTANDNTIRQITYTTY